ncbi:MAG: molybdate ABC transporter substrate-binding protein [Actinomycetota bacterium]
MTRVPAPHPFGILVALALLLPAACNSNENEAGASTELTVFAAASLTDAFEELGRVLEAESPGLAVTFNFLSSSELAAQIEQGAPADVFASADETNMEVIERAGLLQDAPRTFARNLLQIAVPPGNPGDVREPADLEDPELVVTLCAEECPAGRYTAEVFEKGGLEVDPDSREADVRAVLTRVETAEADAGIVYRTDVAAAGDAVEGIDIPEDLNVVATYPIATLVDAPGAADDFIDVVMSERGQRVLLDYGFLGA